MKKDGVCFYPMSDIFEPYMIRDMLVRNRFMRSATTSAYSDEKGIVNDTIIKHYEKMSKGECGLIIKGHLYILETPLYRVRNKQATRYCYSEAEREAAEAEIRGAEVTRFKGLGEISPGEFGRFIGDDCRLLSVSVNNISEVSHCLDFFMGKNTPERKSFIIENLSTEVVQ